MLAGRAPTPHHQPRRLGRAALATTVLGTSIAVGSALVTTPPPAAALTATTTFTGVGTYVVPAGVTALEVVIDGGRGGTGESGAGSAGGSGRRLTGTIRVEPGDVLRVAVGQDGGSGSPTAGGLGGATGSAEPSTWTRFDGGAGGTSVADVGHGGGGGAGTAIWRLGESESLLAVAGGGGGGGGRGVMRPNGDVSAHGGAGGRADEAGATGQGADGGNAADPPADPWPETIGTAGEDPFIRPGSNWVQGWGAGGGGGGGGGGYGRGRGGGVGTNDNIGGAGGGGGLSFVDDTRFIGTVTRTWAPGSGGVEISYHYQASPTTTVPLLTLGLATLAGRSARRRRAVR